MREGEEGEREEGERVEEGGRRGREGGGNSRGKEVVTSVLNTVKYALG